MSLMTTEKTLNFLRKIHTKKIRLKFKVFDRVVNGPLDCLVTRKKLPFKMPI